jgi:hypothetical protein
MAWGIRAVIRVPEGQVHTLGELKLNEQPYGYPTREMCSEVIEMLVRGPLLQFRGMLEPFETGREISPQTGRGQQSRVGMGEFSLSLNTGDHSDGS